MTLNGRFDGRTYLGMLIGAMVVVGNSLIVHSCMSNPSSGANPEPVKDHFTEVSSQYWGSWKLYTLHHDSGACFVVIWPNGEGAGSITGAPETVCQASMVTFDKPIPVGKGVLEK